MVLRYANIYRLFNKQLTVAQALCTIETVVITKSWSVFSCTLYVKAIWRQVQAFGLVRRYNTDDRVRLQVRQLMALAFAPVLLVRNIFNQLRAASRHCLRPLFVYFDNQWVMGMPLSLWNMYRVSRRTNNNLEGWHLRFSNIVRRHRPNIWQLICALQEEQSSTEVQRQQIAVGQIVQRQEKKYKKVDKNIKTLCNQYRHGHIDVMQYITGVSHNLASY